MSETVQPTAIPSEINQSTEIGNRMALESSMVLGALALAAAHLESGNNPQEMPPIKWYQIEGGREEMRDGAESAEFVAAYTDRVLDINELLHQTGAVDQASEIIGDLAYGLSSDSIGGFKEAIERGFIDSEQAYRIFSAIAKSPDSRNTMFSYLSGRKTYEFRLYEGEDDPRSKLTNEVFNMALVDTTENGAMIRQMFAEYLANGLLDVDKSDPTIKNPNMLVSILETTGLTKAQADDVFEAIFQSKKETYGNYHEAERTARTLQLFADLKEKSDSDEQYVERVQKLYKTFGIRNFYRYTADQLLPQLAEDFKPEEVVVTAFSDEGGALSKPANSSEGLAYQKPIYFEAKQGIDIAKALIVTKKMRGSKPIEKVLIRAHGAPDGFLLSRKMSNGVIIEDDLIGRTQSGKGWEQELVSKGVVSKDAEVVFESCSLGAGSFPKSLYQSTGIETILTSPANIVGSSVEGAPGVMRMKDGSIRFGIAAPDFTTKQRAEDGIVEPVSFSKT